MKSDIVRELDKCDVTGAYCVDITGAVAAAVVVVVAGCCCVTIFLFSTTTLTDGH